MNRVALLILAGLVLGGGLVWGQWGQWGQWVQSCPPPTACPPPPCCPPSPPEPSCYDGFWIGEPIVIEVVVPVGRGCCCPVTLQITGWSVQALGGAVVHEHTYATPVSATTLILWHQKTSAGIQVGPGFYLITVRTSDGKALQSYVRIADRSYCRSSLCSRPSKPCGVPICDPHLKLSALPVIGPCCDPCCDPCCLQPYYIIGGGK